MTFSRHVSLGSSWLRQFLELFHGCKYPSIQRQYLPPTSHLHSCSCLWHFASKMLGSGAQMSPELLTGVGNSTFGGLELILFKTKFISFMSSRPARAPWASSPWNPHIQEASWPVLLPDALGRSRWSLFSLPLLCPPWWPSPCSGHRHCLDGQITF